MPFEWVWNDGQKSRGRKPACLVVTPSGGVHRFTGKSIAGVVQVTNEKFHKNGKWSNTDYFCEAPEGTSVYSWQQSFEDGVFWPQASWDEAVGTVQKAAPQAKAVAIEAIIRLEWPNAAEKFDENRKVLADFSVKPVLPAEQEPVENKEAARASTETKLQSGFVQVPLELLYRLIADANPTASAVWDALELLEESDYLDIAADDNPGRKALKLLRTNPFK